MTCAGVLLIAIYALLLTLLALGITRASRRLGRSDAETRRSCWQGVALYGLWLALLLGLGASGLLADFTTLPPRFVVFIVVVLLAAVAASWSSLGSLLAMGLPLRALVGFQGFRVLVEIALVVAYHEGLAPVQMTLEGYNFDIVSGVTALLVMVAMTRRPRRWLVVAWSIGAFALLVTIVVIALLSAPTPLRYFMNEPANTWVAHAPYILLPGAAVHAALVGHFLVLRRLWRETQAAPSA